jgi:hypothetical protein
VQLEDNFGGVSRFLMQVIDILGDNAVEFAHFLQLRDCQMGAIGFGIGKQPAFQEDFPLFFPGLGIAQELVDRKIFRIEFCPDTAGAAEIGDTRFGADPGPREYNDPPGFQDACRNVLDCLVNGAKHKGPFLDLFAGVIYHKKERLKTGSSMNMFWRAICPLRVANLFYCPPQTTPFIPRQRGTVYLCLRTRDIFSEMNSGFLIASSEEGDE